MLSALSNGKAKLALLVLCTVSVAAHRPLHDLQAALNIVAKPEPEFTGEVWALLIAGSAGWGNYRHQADVAHAYQVLHNGGLDDEHIVVMHADDIANDFQNPHPGKVFNKPGGPDVYKGLPKDYTGENVNAENFLRVLEGREDTPASLGSSGKVIKSGPNDRVFVYFADHGAPGILGMPSGSFLYADQFLGTLHNKSLANGFAEMVVYIEACESGSIFQGLLDDSLKIYAVTAANAVESSWGVYCPGMDPAPPAEFSTCLGDLFSVSFLENDDTANLLAETLEAQYELVKKRTSNNGTYQQGSHALQFGSLMIDTEPVSNYLGTENTGVSANADAVPSHMGAVHQREADLLPLRIAVQRAANPTAKAAAQAALSAELGRRAAVDQGMRTTFQDLLQQPSIAAALLGAAGSNLAASSSAAAVEMLLTKPLQHSAHAAVVDDWDCLRAMLSAWEASCGRLSQYGMQYSRAFANACNAGVPVAALAAQASKTCAATAVV